MSHVTEVKLKVRDLDALEEAGAVLGLDLRRGQKSFTWYGRFVGDSTPPKGRNPNDYGKCDHALRQHDHQAGDYEIGIVKALDGDGYDLMFDYWGPGQKLSKKCGGNELHKLKHEYAVAVARRKAQATLAKKGWVIGERIALEGGRTKLKLRKR